MGKAPGFRPFRHLNRLLQEKAIDVEAMPAVHVPDGRGRRLSPHEEQKLFLNAMADVRPLTGAKTAAIHPRRPTEKSYHLSEDERVLHQLQHLIDSGRGYRIADTPEYIEGRGFRVPDAITRRLHRGVFAVQAHIDLHGMGVAAAGKAVDDFLNHAVRQGLRTVLIIHGRGLSSPGEPVLKSQLVKWLNRRAWRKWLLAYTSARACDGGAGATYVLLRKRPMPKHLRKRFRRAQP